METSAYHVTREYIRCMSSLPWTRSRRINIRKQHSSLQISGDNAIIYEKRKCINEGVRSALAEFLAVSRRVPAFQHVHCTRTNVTNNNWEPWVTIEKVPNALSFQDRQICSTNVRIPQCRTAVENYIGQNFVRVQKTAIFVIVYLYKSRIFIRKLNTWFNKIWGYLYIALQTFET